MQPFESMLRAHLNRKEGYAASPGGPRACATKTHPINGFMRIHFKYRRCFTCITWLWNASSWVGVPYFKKVSFNSKKKWKKGSWVDRINKAVQNNHRKVERTYYRSLCHCHGFYSRGVLIACIIWIMSVVSVGRRFLIFLMEELHLDEINSKSWWTLSYVSFFWKKTLLKTRQIVEPRSTLHCVIAFSNLQRRMVCQKAGVSKDKLHPYSGKLCVCNARLLVTVIRSTDRLNFTNTSKTTSDIKLFHEFIFSSSSTLWWRGSLHDIFQGEKTHIMATNWYTFASRPRPFLPTQRRFSRHFTQNNQG